MVWDNKESWMELCELALQEKDLPSGPLRTTTLPPGPESIVRLSASFCVWMGAALNLARILSTRSAAEGAVARSPLRRRGATSRERGAPERRCRPTSLNSQYVAA